MINNGYIYKWNHKNPSGYGNNFETIEELNAAYMTWRNKQIKLLEVQRELKAPKNNINAKTLNVGVNIGSS